jgi:hypothetical protein
LYRDKNCNFTFILCTDLKAWALMSIGAGNSLIYACCSHEHTFRHVPIGVCDSCKRSNPDRVTACIYSNMHVGESLEDIKKSLHITCEVPPNASSMSTPSPK